MKNKKIWVALGLGLMMLIGLSSAHAVMFRMLGGKELSQAADSSGSMAFKGKVTKIEQKQEGQAITFHIQDALRGKINNGEVLTLEFPNPKYNNNLRLSMGIPPPQNLSVGAETVLFVTTNVAGKTFLIGGDQGQYYISNEGGKQTVYNRLGNANFFSEKEMAQPLMQKVVQGMRERNSGSIPYNDFKKLLNQ